MTGGLSHWDVSKVNLMEGTFQDASAFLSDLENWDVGEVTSMKDMFKGASSFNSELDSWDVSSFGKFIRHKVI